LRAALDQHLDPESVMECLIPARQRRAACGRWPGLAGAGLIAALGMPTPALADDSAELRQELKEMRRQYDAELSRLKRDYDARLARLEARLKAAQKPAPAAEAPPVAVATAPPAVGVGPAPPPAAGPPAPVPGATPPVTFAVGTPPREPWPIGSVTPPPVVGPPASAGSFNPAIGVVLQGKASYFSKNPDTYRVRGFALGDEAGPGTRGLSLDETELNLQANVDPYLFGNLTLSISPENHLSIEEAFIQTTSLPGGFTLRAGRFFSGIGYLNEQHSHTWDFADQALPYRVFLNNQYDDDGVQLRWLAPTVQFVELGAEIFRGAAFPAAGPAHVGFGSFSLFGHTGGDISESSSYRTGLSWLHTRASDRATAVPGSPDDIFNGKSDTLIVDAIYKWAPNGNPVDTNLKLQGEFVAHRDEGQFNSLLYKSGWQTGFYAQAAYQFMPRWRLGLRYDQVNSNRQTALLAASTVDSLGATPRRASAMLEYNTSEFGRFRLQYNRDWSRGVPDNQGILQYLISFGAHGAHLF
jgi:hypothetical protein